MMNSAAREHIVLDGIDPALFRLKLLGIPDKVVVLLDWKSDVLGCEWLAGYDIHKELRLSPDDPDVLYQTDQWLDENQDWRLGYFSYDLKNVIEPHRTFQKQDVVGSDYVYLFVPQILFMEKEGKLHAYPLKGIPLPDWQSWQPVDSSGQHLNILNIPFEPTLSWSAYQQRVDLLKDHIRRGDIYEINFCTEWKSNRTIPQPGAIYQHLWQELQAPFSSFANLNDLILICNSPERFLAKRGNLLISQPIKGTSPRSADQKTDEMNRQKLLAEKERTENVMIVDLVRNDLSKVAVKGTVRVDELFGIYSFNQVHQLISTISCQLQEGKKFSDILRATFPMGSMTGAPKISAMQLAEQFEPMHRGMYSGSIGFFDPEGNFDWNVIIRSLISDKRTGITVARAGSAITWDSDPDMEWEECVVKIEKLIS